MIADRLQQAYLVRLWAVHRNGELLWRASIENVHSGERHAFADLAGLCHFFQSVTAGLPVTLPNEAEQERDPNDE